MANFGKETVENSTCVGFLLQKNLTRNYFDPRAQKTRANKEAQENSDEKDNPRKTRKWLISKQYLQPLECPEDSSGGGPLRGSKGFRRAVEAAKYGMKEGLLTGTFFGGSWGIFKVFNDGFVIHEDRRRIPDARTRRRVETSTTYETSTSQDESRKTSIRTGTSAYSSEKNEVKKDDKKTEGRIAGVMSNRIRADTRNDGYTELLPHRGADSYDTNRFSYKKVGEKIEIVGYSFIKTTGSMTGKNSGTEDDRSDDSDTQRRAGNSRDRDPGKNKPNQPEVQAKPSNFKEKSSNMTRLDVIEESQSTKTIKDNFTCFKDRLLCKTASNKILQPRCFRSKENKAAKESHSPGKSKFDGFHIHRGFKNKNEGHKDRRNEENVYPRFGHKFSYLVDVDLIGNGYLSDIEVNTKTREQSKSSRSKKHSVETKVIHPKNTLEKDKIEGKKSFTLADSPYSRPSYHGESDQSMNKESHTVIRRSIIKELKKEKSNAAVSKSGKFGELHRQRSFSVTPEDGTSHYRDLNKKKSYTIGSEESTQISDQSYTIRTPSAKPSPMERGERASVAPEDIIPLLDKIPKQRSYVITSTEKGPEGGRISKQESIGYSEIQAAESYPATPEGMSLPVNDTISKEKALPQTPVSIQESEYRYGKEKGPPYAPMTPQESEYTYTKEKGPLHTPISAEESQYSKDKERSYTAVSGQESHYRYSKTKESLTPVSAQESQYRYAKEKEALTPVSVQESHYRYSKEKEALTPVSAQESHYRHSKPKESLTPISAQESQYKYSKEKEDLMPASVQDSRYGFSEASTPKSYIPPQELAKSSVIEVQKVADSEVASADAVAHARSTTKQKKATVKAIDKHHETSTTKIPSAVSEKTKPKTYDLKAPDTISEMNEIDQRSYVLSSEFGSYVRNERTAQEPDFINSPTVVEPIPYRKASESTLEKEFKAIDKKFEPDSVSGYFEAEREISYSPLEDTLRGTSLEKNISNFIKAVFSSQENSPSRKSIVAPSIKTEVTTARVEVSPIPSEAASRALQENMILFGACNCAIILGILCSVLSCTRAYLAG